MTPGIMVLALWVYHSYCNFWIVNVSLMIPGWTARTPFILFHPGPLTLFALLRAWLRPTVVDTYVHNTHLLKVSIVVTLPR